MKIKATILFAISLFALTSCGGNQEDSSSEDRSIKEFTLPEGRYIASGLVSDANVFYTFDTEAKTVDVKRYYALKEVVNDTPIASQSFVETYTYEFCKRIGDVAVYNNTIASIYHNNYKYSFFYKKNDNGTKGEFHRFSGSTVVDEENPSKEKIYNGVSYPAIKFSECNIRYFLLARGKEFVSDDSVQFALETGTKLYYIKAKFDANYKVSIFYSKDGKNDWERFRSNIALDYLTPDVARNRMQGLFLDNYNPDVNTFQIEMSSHFAARVRLVEE